MLIFIQTLKANLKTNKIDFHSQKETKSKQGKRKRKPSFREVFFTRKNKKQLFRSAPNTNENFETEKYAKKTLCKFSTQNGRKLNKIGVSRCY